MKTVAVMTTHVDIRTCQKESSTWTNFWGSLNPKPSGIAGSNSPRPPMRSITVDVSDNTFKIKPITIGQGRPHSDALQPHELSQLRGLRCQARPDLLYASLNHTKLNFPYEPMTWEELGVLSAPDASFANEERMKSQQGRCPF